MVTDVDRWIEKQIYILVITSIFHPKPFFFPKALQYPLGDQLDTPGILCEGGSNVFFFFLLGASQPISGKLLELDDVE